MKQDLARKAIAGVGDLGVDVMPATYPSRPSPLSPAPS